MTTVETGHPALAPYTLGSLPLRNCLAVAPMTRVSAQPDGTPTDRMAEYYREYARGGFGLIITEGAYPDITHSQGYANQPGLATDRHITGWRKVVDAVHDAGSTIIAQLMHAGAISQGNAYGYESIGPSAVSPRGQKMASYGGAGDWSTPRAMTARDIDAAVAGFAAAAVNAKAAGFDGVEIHGANGYLLDQFLTDYTNQRTDEYGGAVHNRIRLTATVLAAVRDAVGYFPVGVRLSQTKVNDFTYRWPGAEDDAQVIFEALSEATYLHIAGDGGSTVTRLAREMSGRPVIANGGLADLRLAADVLNDEHADVLAFGQAALANPDLPQLLRSGAELAAYDPEMLRPTATLDSASEWRARRKSG
ncbi:NADH:flavin oxidoreductase [Nocardia sp. NPDC058658]|uniref:oxidoreductase n=1 Tax=Nocardia sp. NPDC058658 TaxID=3346580 RepID=UPI00365C69DC